MIAALYVQKGGCYFGLQNVDPWDEERDARNYAGPHPVVAHPPCARWVNFAGHNYIRYTRERGRPQPHLRPGNDGGCFARALESVRKWGGVLEHPAGTHAWTTFALTNPRVGRWTADARRADEWVCEVSQAAYGHAARKRTWLLYVGPPPAALDWRTVRGTHQCGWFDRAKPTLGKAEANATPEPFRDMLIDLAEKARLQ